MLRQQRQRGVADEVDAIQLVESAARAERAGEVVADRVHRDGRRFLALLERTGRDDRRFELRFPVDSRAARRALRRKLLDEHRIDAHAAARAFNRRPVRLDARVERHRRTRGRRRGRRQQRAGNEGVQFLEHARRRVGYERSDEL
ncbi:hypothetical protein NX868_10290 [Burkholderia thailandensis]|uniref:hypothetical protein n=1 Tax=Burkholderia thailandensis TaxID=57975 RepID=UPI00217ECAA6|nr:hypothetical protein [Burkholderia thailandensis]MCS6455950.1 hypothetical protein [Burkholderia thailandensis]MCS6482665.1 hypothetical protein [Burkholderia thailandensis]